MRKPSSSKEIIEIDSDEVGGGMLALCGEVNASCNPLNTLANKTSMQIVLVDDSDSVLEYDVEYKKYLASYGLNHQYMLESGTSPMRLMYNVDDGSEDRAVKVDKRRAGSPLISSFSKKFKTENGEADLRSISRTVQETRQKKEDGRRGRKSSVSVTKNKIQVKPIGNLKDTKQMKEDGRWGRKSSVTKNIFKACKEENEEISAKRNAHSQTDFRASKRLKAEKNIPMVNTKETQRKKEDARQVRKSSATKNNFKACKKENEESSARRYEKPQAIFRASKRLSRTVPVVNTKRKKGDASRERKIPVTKANVNSISRTIPVVNTKQKKGEASRERKIPVAKTNVNSISRTIPVVNTKQKKGEASRERKIPVTETNVKSKSTSHVKDNLLNSFKACKKEIEESRSSIDKSYEYFLSYLRNSLTIFEPDRKLTIFEPDRKVKPEKDLVSLSDPDIIAISDYPFSDGGNSPFAANKDGKVIDLEDGIEPDIIFNSSFSKKLLEILRNPYDKKEFLQRCNEASRKRQLTRSRQLRDGKEIEYNVEDQLGLSYLEQYPDFNKKFRRCRYGKDPARALNLLRGFFFYFENIVLEGAYKPWLHEKLVRSECQDTVCIK